MEKENKNKKECSLCKVSEETIESLKRGGRQEYLAQKEEKEKVRLQRVRNRKIKKIAIVSLLFLFVAGGIAFGILNYSPGATQLASEKQEITVFYSPTCSCCVQYLSYLKRNGFEVLEEKEMAKRMDLLEKYQIPDEMTSCHTSLVGDYFVEGHMPVEIIKKLLEEKPKIDGIALPGMPQGSPGMEGFKTGKWTIYGFLDGISSEFALY